MPEHEYIELERRHSDDISDLIGNPPGWILRSGISVVAIAVVLILILAYYIQYPDKITCEGIVTTAKSTVELVSTRNGVIEELYPVSLERIDERTPVIYYQNTAKKADVEDLMNEVKKLKSCRTPVDINRTRLTSDLIVGPMNTYYSALELQLSELDVQLSQKGVFQHISAIEDEISHTDSLVHSKNKETDIYREEMRIINADFIRHKKLLADSLISIVEFEEVEKRFLQAKRQLESMKTGNIQNRIIISQLELQKSQLREERSEKLIILHSKINETISRLEEQYGKWYEENHLSAENHGLLELNSLVQEGMSITAGTLVGNTIPDTTDNILIARAFIPSRGKGKMDIGDRCIIRFAAYPYKEYGSMISSVENVTRVPKINEDGSIFYEATVALTMPMVTDYGEHLSYTPNMDATFQIVTESRSIIERIFEQILNIIKNT